MGISKHKPENNSFTSKVFIVNSMGYSINYGEISDSITDSSNQNIENVNLVKAAAVEINKLLTELDKFYPTKTTTDKMLLVVEVVKKIENNPNLTNIILNLLKVRSIRTLEQFLSHPAANFMIGALEDWLRNKEV